MRLLTSTTPSYKSSLSPSRHTWIVTGIHLQSSPRPHFVETQVYQLRQSLVISTINVPYHESTHRCDFDRSTRASDTSNNDILWPVYPHGETFHQKPTSYINPSVINAPYHESNHNCDLDRSTSASDPTNDYILWPNQEISPGITLTPNRLPDDQ